MTRDPVVAGQFYPGTRETLIKELSAFFDPAAKKEDAIGVVSPHAGYIYSGAVAGSVFSAIKPKPVYIILGPNHTGLGRPFGISTCNSWKTPLGPVEIDKALAAEIKANCRYIEYDDLSHSAEHSIEVQLPFIQYRQKGFRFVPIVISGADLDVYRDIGRAIAKSVKKLKMEKVVAVIASSDMTHYESAETAMKKDKIAIDAILKLDEAALLEEISRHDITMCGYAPAAIMIAASKELGAKSSRLVKYRTSGDATGDDSSVVGYAGIIIF